MCAPRHFNRIRVWPTLHASANICARPWCRIWKNWIFDVIKNSPIPAPEATAAERRLRETTSRSAMIISVVIIFFHKNDRARRSEVFIHCHPPPPNRLRRCGVAVDVAGDADGEIYYKLRRFWRIINYSHDFFVLTHLFITLTFVLSDERIETKNKKT